jgi:antitoxin component YwqK of YwqJK toxin-antitoxin module
MMEVTYNSCGARQECMVDENFEKHGYCLVYDRHETLRKVCFYNHGSREGSYVSWHRNGIVKCLRTYKDDIPVGIEEEYDRDGKIVYRMNWDSIDRKIFQGEAITMQDFRIYHPRFQPPPLSPSS